MPRYALKVEYNGGPFVGWQRQKEHVSVQGRIEDALAMLEQGRPQTIAAAGRTDAGVHAWGQVAHCEMSREWEPFRLVGAINYHLKPDPISIVACAQVDDDWHARFSALERRYEFRMLMRRSPATHDAGLVWQVPRQLDLAAMQEGAQHLLGMHDFTTFRSTKCQAVSPIKTLDELTVRQIDGPSGPEIRFTVRSRSFLHNQVRSFVGTLECVGSGMWTPDDVKTALEARDRTACGTVSPPEGLYLAHVTYPTDVFAGYVADKPLI
jgi:tRNA pseudouridine38-40 synthase